jgi:hypothetical protein
VFFTKKEYQMKKMFTSMFLVLTLLALTAGSAFAQTATPIAGTVQSVVLETNTVSGKTIAIVTILDETTNVSQTVKLSQETALTLGLIATDPITGKPIVAPDAVGKAVEVDPTTVLPEGEPIVVENQHPVGSALADFFSGLVGVNYETIMTYHEDGVGFGVIAKALWMTKNMDGDTATFEALLDAKLSGDYSNIILADGTTPTTWGDVVKSLKKGNNLGRVMSGKDKNNQDVTGQNVIEVPANGHGNSNNGATGGNGNADNHDNGGNNGNGNGHGNGNGGGRP